MLYRRVVTIPSIHFIGFPNCGSDLRREYYFAPAVFHIDHGRSHQDAFSAAYSQRTYARAYKCWQRPPNHRET